MRTSLTLTAALLLGLAAAGEPPAPPAFAKKPAVTREGEKVKIEFAASRETDVAVYIENAKGEIVRHLVAGVLGKNPPEPLKAGSLEQSVAWDGQDDDGKPAAGGPFRVRVGLGLKAGWAGTAFSDKTGPNHISSVQGLAAGPDGRVYVMDERCGWLYWPASAVHVFLRDGSYEKTIKPFPAHLSLERLKGTGVFKNDRGWLNPLIHRTLGMTFYPFEDEPAAQMAVSPDGRLYLATVPSQAPPTSNPAYRGSAPHIAAIDLEGGVPNPGYAGPALGKALAWRGERGEGGARLAVSSDGKGLYVVNLGHTYYENMYKFKRHPAVYRAPLPAMGPAEIFFGEKDKPGNDEKHLNDPMGIATDGKGLLFVADRGNNRIAVLKEADGSFAGAIPVEAPEWVAVHPKTGAVYAHSKDSIVKFSGWKDAKETGRLSFQRFATVAMGWGPARPAFSFALDGSAEPAVLWIGRSLGTPTLLRCEDRGGSLTEPEPARCFVTPGRWRPASDPTHRLVSCRVDEVDAMKGSAVHVLDEATGQVRKVRPAGGAIGNGQGTTSRLDRDGNIYSCAADGGIWKCDPTGKRVPFPATAADPKLKGHIPAGSTGTTAWERDWCVDRKGDIYSKVAGTSYHGLMHVDVFGPDGAKKRTVLFGATDGAYGPRVDPQGNVYMMECVKPAGQPFPDELKPYATDKMVQHWYDWIYGSIVKFPPAGGNILLTTGRKDDHPRAEPVKLPDSVEKRKVHATFRGGDNFLQGALWMAPGVAHVGDMGVAGGGEHCHCTGCDFDVDDFGRSFAPDNGRQRVTVFDTNGNVIAHFGAYGNQDFCGPDSYVLDPQGKFLRPRKPDDPKDLKSPFAEPEIAFNFIIGLAVTDQHAYVADCANRRMLRVKLDYAAAETAPVP